MRHMLGLREPRENAELSFCKMHLLIESPKQEDGSQGANLKKVINA